MKRTRRSGFSLVEVLIALTILGLLTINIAMVSRTGSQAAESDLFRQLLDTEMDLTLDRIKLALMSASADNVYPQVPAPASESHIDFSTSLGVQGGVHVMGDPERIQWTPATAEKGGVFWTQSLGLPDERQIQWSRNVPILQNLETANERDDNDNGLVDEPGLSFHVEHAEDRELQVFVNLTVSKTDSRGQVVPRSRQVNITCRN
ncbi:MAG TPA: prepilin-type N-terminal cleavage/methylation domain-containing protein [Planctomycetota bacterium]|nr:prepilin-type N-terminal cleavage/methylation domain-containing protein [Planctomycetota bacterium]